MHKIWMAMSMVFVFGSLSGQDKTAEGLLKTYQSAGNEYYWKNRMPNAAYWQQDVAYVIKAKLNDSTEIITGSESIAYANNSPDTIYQLYFRLSQNAFQPNSYKDKMEQGGKVKNDFGKYESQKLGTEILHVKINNTWTNFILDNTIMIVNLNNPLLPNQKLSIDIDFKTYFDQGSMRRRMKRFEHDNFKHFDGVHWYPRLSVYDRKFKWTTDQHMGKEFYGDFGAYNVKLSLPNHYICEATGLLQNKDVIYANGLREKIDIANFSKPSATISTPVIPNGTYKEWDWYALNVHDFAFTTDPTYRIGEVIWNGISCIALAQEQNAYRWQPTARYVANIIKTYSEDIGMYAYPKMVAADARDGMEYPMITLDGGTWPGHQNLIAHEVGHNWFYGMVGNNETYRSALDEGFTQFLTAWSLKSLSKKTQYPNPIEWGVVYAGYINHAINENTARLNIHADHYNSVERHGGGYGQVYYKTATMLFNLQYVLGDELFLAAMKNYFNTWKICHPYEEDFRQSIIDYTKVDLNWFFDAWITTTQTIDYKVQKVKKVKGSKDEYQITIKRKGELHMPLDIAVIDKNGGVKSYIIPNGYFAKKPGNAIVKEPWISWDMMNKTYTFKVSSPDGIANVKIDSTGRLADINRLNNSLKTPMTFKRERLKQDGSDFKVFQNYWRPDVWYNQVDGIKLGLNFSGNYYHFKHIYSATVWYNSGIEKTSFRQDPNSDLIDFRINYKTRIGRKLDLSTRLKSLEGIKLFELGLEKYLGKNKFEIGYKAFGLLNKRYFNTNNDEVFNNQYSFYPQYFTENLLNATLNLGYERSIKYFKGLGLLKIDLRNTALFSDYNYSGVTLNYIQHTPIGKLNLRSRIFAQYLDGNVPKESSLFLAGANNEELIENKFTRSRGIIPNEWIGYGKPGAFPFQLGGGLNIRGMAGYQATNSDGNDTFFMFNGTQGAAINLELELGNLFHLNAPKLKQWLMLDPYLFADAGVLGDGRNSSGLRADAGIGTTIKLGVGKYNNVQPLVLRFDIPFYLNRVDASSNYLDFRYVFGINRAF